MVLAAPELVEPEAVEMRCEVDVALELQHRVFTRGMVRCKEGAEAEAGHRAIVRRDENVARTGPLVRDARPMPSTDERIVLRPATETDVDALAAVQSAQDIAWWGAPDGGVDELRAAIDRVRVGGGNLRDASRVAVHSTPAGEVVAGFAMLFGHGQSNIAVDPACGVGDLVTERLATWLLDVGATDFEAPGHDTNRRAVFDRLGLAASRSSFELERLPTIDDLGSAVWPDGIAPAAFRHGVDDAEIHALVYSVWTDVPGHTHRPIDEWRALFLRDVAEHPELVIVARFDRGLGAAAGVALSRTFAGEVGWVSQLAVGRPARGVGLGRSLLVEAFHRLARLDVGVLGLSVEADNAAALGLYRSVGLVVTREWVHHTQR